MNEFWEDLVSGEIQYRDRFQFEMKSEMEPGGRGETVSQTQEFYFFVPSSLQINEKTYTKEQFYNDQMNMIRFKTPIFALRELMDLQNRKSPLTRLKGLLEDKQSYDALEIIEDESKLLANIIRSACRREVLDLLLAPHESEPVLAFTRDLKRFLNDYRQLVDAYQHQWPPETLHKHLHYIEAFMSHQVDYYLTGYLHEMRKRQDPNLPTTDQPICTLLVDEQKLREERLGEKRGVKANSFESELILYRNGLLKKFVSDALQLNISRYSFTQTFNHLIGAFAAGVAMLLYVSLLFWYGSNFLINSAPFLILSVFLYIIKDRVKEWLKNASLRTALKWFPDFTTKIQTPNEKITLGTLKESFGYVKEETLPQEIQDIREKQFHTVVDAFKRRETVMVYKQIITLNAFSTLRTARRMGVIIVSRLSVDYLLNKAGSPFHQYMALDPQTREVLMTHLPKVYHLNIIICTTTHRTGTPPLYDLKKYRLILDKNGIRHIDQIRAQNKEDI